MSATTAGSETREFQAEARQVLDLMIHSVYSNRDVFLRELISNASDALDKLRFEALTHAEFSEYTANPSIRISVDKEAGTLTIADSGIGMSRDEVVRYIGTIARSGTGEFAKALREAKDAGHGLAAPDLIGKFGVGFYSAFMVADRVELVTRRAGEQNATRWFSAGDGAYTLDDAEREAPGTTIVLHLKEDARGKGATSDEDGRTTDYSDVETLRGIVRKHSDFVSHPIFMAKADDAAEVEQVNSGRALWTRPQAEVTEEEFTEFYRHVSRDWGEPLHRLHVNAEGSTQFRALLFIPSRTPFDMMFRGGDGEESRDGLQLYIRRVFILAGCKDLVPDWLRFLRGVVDSEDLALNVSREMLQKDRTVRVIQRSLVRKVLESLRHLREDSPEKFATFYKEFGAILKEGLLRDEDRREAILDLCQFASTHETSEGEAAKAVTFDQYLERAGTAQDTIWYLVGPDVEQLRKSPHLEAFRAKGVEVLLLTDPVDEAWTQQIDTVKGKSFRNAGKGTVDLSSSAEDREKAEEQKKAKAEELKDLLSAMQKALDQHIKEVRVSDRLTSSPACLVGETYDLTPQLEAVLKASGRFVPPTRRILEINVDHPVLQRLKSIHAVSPDDERIGEFSQMLHAQAVLAEGGLPPDPAKAASQLASMMEKALGTA